MRALELYIKAKEHLLSEFNFPYVVGMYEVCDYTDVIWGWEDNYIPFIYKGDEYGFVSPSEDNAWYYGDYTMIVVNDDNGHDDFLAIFDNNKRNLD